MSNDIYSSITLVFAGIIVLSSIYIIVKNFYDNYKGKHFLVFQQVKYRTVAAHEAIIGSVGLKRTTGKNRYELKFIPTWEDLPIINTTNFDKTLNVESKLSLIGPFKNGINSDAQTENSLNMKGKYYLFRVADSELLVQQLNDSSNLSLRKKLAENSNYRIITASIVVYDQEMTEKVSKTAGVNFSLNSNGKGLQSVDVTSQGDKLIKLSMSNGTIYAYEFSRICWKSKLGEGDKPYEIASIMADRPVKGVKGSDRHDCPSGQTIDPTEVIKDQN